MRTTVTLPDVLAEHVDDQRPSADDSDAEAVRECIRRSQQLDECRQRVKELESELERLEREKRLILEEREEHSQLVRAVEREQEIAEKRARAGVLQRAKWWLTGMDDE